MSKEAFVNMVVEVLSDEYGIDKSSIAQFRDKIAALHEKEGSVTEDELRKLCHGGGDLAEKFPGLDNITLEVSALDDEDEDGEDEEDEDSDDDDEDED